MIAWENSWHFVMLALVWLRHDIWETSADIPYWWCISTQLRVVPDWLCREKNLLQPQKPRSIILVVNLISMEFLHFVLMTSLHMEISGGVMKCQLFSQATVTGMLLKKANLIYSIPHWDCRCIAMLVNSHPLLHSSEWP